MTTEALNQTVFEASYGRIRGDIIFGRLSSGQKLTLDKLRASYGASVSTLREILNRLSSEGLVIAEGQRGFRVSPMSIADLREIAALRLLLEAHAIEESFARGDTEWEAQLAAAHYKLKRMEDLMATGNVSKAEDWKRYDWEFHQALISACGSRLLRETHSGIFDRYLRYQMLALSYRGGIAAREHQQLFDAAMQRDADAAKRVLAIHINGGVEHALASGTLR